VKERRSSKACRAKLADPPASGNRTVPSLYVAAVHAKISPATMKTSGVNPSVDGGEASA